MTCWKRRGLGPLTLGLVLWSTSAWAQPEDGAPVEGEDASDPAEGSSDGDESAPEQVELEEEPQRSEAARTQVAQPGSSRPQVGKVADGMAGKEAKLRVEPKPDAEAKPKRFEPKGTFTFGSYGRVAVASDGRGGRGRDADIVAYGSRIDESTYAELEFGRHDKWDRDVTTHIITTLALQNPIFHEDGQFDAVLALRNLYVEEQGIIHEGLSVWIGSRMYRGDDIYLLNFWPLDNLNTVGGGFRFDFNEKRTFAAWHVGQNIIDSPFQRQTIQRPPALNQPGTQDIPLLDRPRTVTSLKLSHIFPVGEKGGIKVKLYGEAHLLPEGEREDSAGLREDLPGDNGAVLGAQVGYFTGKRDTFVNLFVRHATGLAAYGEFGTPQGTADDETVDGARETLVAIAANWEWGPLAVPVGAYFRSFRDASPEPLRFENVDEGIIIARPHFYIGERAGIAVEGSYQQQQRGVLNPATNEPQNAALTRFAVVPFLSPAGRGTFRRPQLRLIWAVTSRNDDARALYPADDPFAQRQTEQFFGINAEWWFNSTSYGF